MDCKTGVDFKVLTLKGLGEPPAAWLVARFLPITRANAEMKTKSTRWDRT